MKVILAENVASLGRIGDVVKVAPGYARNFLFPQGLALAATEKNVADLEHKKRVLAQKREKVRQKNLSLAEQLNRVSLTLRRKVADGDKLYGSVSAGDIVRELEAAGYSVERHDVKLPQPIKELGEHVVPIRIDADVSAEVRVVVDKEE
jgi:large subunit ribosomal protein L9